MVKSLKDAANLADMNLELSFARMTGQSLVGTVQRRYSKHYD